MVAEIFEKSKKNYKKISDKSLNISTTIDWMNDINVSYCSHVYKLIETY